MSHKPYYHTIIHTDGKLTLDLTKYYSFKHYGTGIYYDNSGNFIYKFKSSEEAMEALIEINKHLAIITQHNYSANTTL